MLLQNFTVTNWRQLHAWDRLPPPDRVQISVGNRAQNLPQTAVAKCLISTVVPPKSRTPTALMDVTETQEIHINVVSTWMCVTNMNVSVCKCR